MSDDVIDVGGSSTRRSSTTIARLPREFVEKTIKYGSPRDRERDRALLLQRRNLLSRSLTLNSIGEGGRGSDKRHLLGRRVTSVDSDLGPTTPRRSVGAGSAGKVVNRRRTVMAIQDEVKEDGPTPFQRFKRKACAVKWLCMVCIIYMREASERALKGSLLEVVEEILTSAEEEAKRTGNDGNYPKGIISSAYPDMTFDATDFQRFSKREEGLPNKIKEILRMDEEERTPEQIQNVVRSMQSIEEFAKYPPEIQKRMCRCAWYDVFSRNRVIIRDQERAEGMYFILSGKATKTKGGQTYILKKGDKFGEIDLINNTNRSCTVMSKENIELFCIHSQDYPDIFDTKLNVKPEDCLEYLKTLPVFRAWAGHDKLPDFPANWGVQNYRAGQVIVPDSIKNDWIYVIKSGTCDVLKKLTAGVCMIDKSGKFSKEFKKAESAREMEQMNEKMAEKLPAHSRVTFLTTPGPHSARSGRSLRDRQPISGMSEDTISRRKGGSHSAGSTLRSKSLRQCVKKGSSPLTPHCVRVGELEAGDIFDILTVMPGYKHCKSASVSLVSQGAEAIKISKSFFLKYADERVFTEIEMRYEPYPDQDTCLKDLDVTTQWEKYKKIEMRSTMKEVLDRAGPRIMSR
ncbi:cyclic nucleotide-binding domain-containing protein 2-like [Diadema antillarum]|uniref:cyclic nucleotide-binding domain-containing protein 2-like n=1 Tax=Diadema antillarum TaxID=105358 RepID=UPI003A8362B6